MGYFIATSSPLNPTRLASMGRKFERLSRTKGVFAAFSRERVSTWPGVTIDPVGDAKNPVPSQAIIETWQDLKAGGSKLDVPVLGHLSRPPLSDSQAFGLGEEIPITFRHMAIQIFRKPFRKIAKMEAQKVVAMIEAALNNSQSWLYDYWGNYWDGNIQHTFLTGYDVLLTTYRTISGQISFKTPFSHPNSYVAGAGRVNYTNGRPGTAAFETDLRDALAGLIDDSTKGMTMARLEWIVEEARARNIQPMSTPWGEFQIVFMADTVFSQLERDPDYRDTLKYAYMGKELSNPLISRARACVAGAMIYIVPGMHGVQHSGNAIVKQGDTGNGASSLSMPAYGPTTWWVSEDGTAYGLDNNSIKPTLVVGPNALHKMLGKKRFEFTPDSSDFERQQEIVLEAYCNLVRGDVFDDDNKYGNGANAFYINTTSMVYWTWSPRRTAV